MFEDICWNRLHSWKCKTDVQFLSYMTIVNVQRDRGCVLFRMAKDQNSHEHSGHVESPKQPCGHTETATTNQYRNYERTKWRSDMLVFKCMVIELSPDVCAVLRSKHESRATSRGSQRSVAKLGRLWRLSIETGIACQCFGGVEVCAKIPFYLRLST